jgi:hypothetical protein
VECSIFGRQIRCFAHFLNFTGSYLYLTGCALEIVSIIRQSHFEIERRIFMLKRFATLMVAGSIALTSIYGCQTMGRGTGEVAEEVEQGAGEFKEGYNEGKVPD